MTFLHDDKNNISKKRDKNILIVKQSVFFQLHGKNKP